MTSFVRHTGIAAPLLLDNVDTDQIIPSREMKSVTKEGLGEGLFAGWRYKDASTRQEDPEFVLNRPKFRNASILLTGKNFGCGSSREHSVWALMEFGIRVIIGESFGAIFQANSVRNGLLTIRLDRALIDEFAVCLSAGGREPRMTIDLERQCVCAFGTTEEKMHSFDIKPSHRESLLKGLDPINVTLESEAEIEAFIKARQVMRPWLYPNST